MAAASAGVVIAADMGTDGPASMDRPASAVSALAYPMAALASKVAAASRVAAASMAVVLVVASTVVVVGGAAIVKKRDEACEAADDPSPPPHYLWQKFWDPAMLSPQGDDKQ
jgi:hypothetical protein